MKRSWLTLAANFARLAPAPLKMAIYRFRPLAQVIRRSLNRAAPRGLTPVEVASGGLAGTRLVLDLQSEKDLWLGTYEMNLQAAVAELVRPGMVVYDVGANIGYISALLAKTVGQSGRVFAFEPFPENLERLRMNLEASGLADRVVVVWKAVVDHAGDVSFLVGASGATGKVAGSAGRQARPSQAEIRVPAISLDEFVYQDGQPAPDVIKMDIEGGEVLAIPGMRRMLAEHHPVILLEVHGAESAQAAWTGLTAAGYQLSRMATGFPVIPSLEAMQRKEYLVGMYA